MSPHYPRIRVHNLDEQLVLREGVSICFYLHHSHRQVSQKIEAALETFLEATGSDSLGLYADNEGEWNPLDDARWKLILGQVREDPWAIIRLIDGSKNETRFRFDYHGKDLEDPAMNDPGANCALRFSLSTEFLEQVGPRAVRELALRIAQPLPFSYGHTGLSFNGATDVSGVNTEVDKRRLRYPGIDLIETSGLSWELGTRVRVPAWLTFLGQPVLGELGGVGSLRSRLHSPETTVEPLSEDRAVVTLGEWPEAGDIEQGQTLPAYRELARVLEPWTYFDERPFRQNNEAYRRWERRFLDPIPPTST